MCKCFVWITQFLLIVRGYNLPLHITNPIGSSRQSVQANLYKKYPGNKVLSCSVTSVIKYSIIDWFPFDLHTNLCYLGYDLRSSSSVEGSYPVFYPEKDDEVENTEMN